jgi:hypothetical protein
MHVRLMYRARIPLMLGVGERRTPATVRNRLEFGLEVALQQQEELARLPLARVRQFTLFQVEHFLDSLDPVDPTLEPPKDGGLFRGQDAEDVGGHSPKKSKQSLTLM